MTYPQQYGQPGPQPGYPPAQPPQYGGAAYYPQPGAQPVQYGGQAPAQYQQPQAPQPAPAVWDGQAGDEFGTGERRKSISWEIARGQSVADGTRRMLLVDVEPKVVQSRDFDTGALKFYGDNNPMWSVVTGVVDEIGTPMSLWFPRPSAGAASIQSGMTAAELKTLPRGVLIDITKTHEVPDPQGRKNPTKQFATVIHSGPAVQQYATPAQQAVIAQWAVASQLGGQVVQDGQQPGPVYPPQGVPQNQPQQPVYGPPAGQQPGAGGWQPPQPQAPAYGQPAPVQPMGVPAGQPVQAQPQQSGVPGLPNQSFGGFALTQLAALAGLQDAQIGALGHDPAAVKAAVQQAVTAGALPPF